MPTGRSTAPASRRRKKCAGRLSDLSNSPPGRRYRSDLSRLSAGIGPEATSAGIGRRRRATSEVARGTRGRLLAGGWPAAAQRRRRRRHWRGDSTPARVGRRALLARSGAGRERQRADLELHWRLWRHAAFQASGLQAIARGIVAALAIYKIVGKKISMFHSPKVCETCLVCGTAFRRVAVALSRPKMHRKTPPASPRFADRRRDAQIGGT